MTVDERTTDPSGGQTHGENVVRVDWTEFDDPSAGVIEAVGRATGLRPTELPPLHDAVETDSLNVLLATECRGVDSPLRISFRYAGHLVTVSATGETVVRP